MTDETGCHLSLQPQGGAFNRKRNRVHVPLRCRLSPPARCRSGQSHAAAYGADLPRQGAVPVLRRIDTRRVAARHCREELENRQPRSDVAAFGLLQRLHRCSQCRTHRIKGRVTWSVVYIATKN